MAETKPDVNYGVFIGEKKQGETQVIRRVENVDGLDMSPDPGVQTLLESFLNTCQVHTDKPMLGTREGDAYKWKTYGQIRDLATSLGSAIVHLDLAPSEDHEGRSFSFLGIYSKNREEWIIADLACQMYNTSVVTLYDTLGSDSMRYILESTNLRSIVMTASNLNKIFKLKEDWQSSALSTLIVIDPVSQEDKDQASKLGLKIFEMAELIRVGNENRKEYITPSPEDVYTLCFTSGTTGYPKGAMLTHRNMISQAAGVLKIFEFQSTDVYISYLPLAHIYDRMVVNTLICRGASIGFFGGDPTKLSEDMRLLKPTFFPGVPRILNRFYDMIKNMINQLPPNKRTIIEEGIRAKIQLFKRTGQVKHPLYDTLFFGKLQKMFLGGNVRLGLSGAAPISPEILDFLRVTLCYPLIEAYGQTENAAAALSQMVTDTYAGYVGGPISCIEVKLVDIPDMGYTSDDLDESGDPAPRGEICIRGPCIIQGYFKRPQETREALDDEGWLHTGDVGLLFPNKAIKIIDRKKDIFKLAQGEYVVPSRTENACVQSPYVSQAFIYGDSFKNYPVGIIVPDQTRCHLWAKENGVQESWNGLCQNQALRETIKIDIDRVCKDVKINSFEQAKAIHLHPEAMTVDNDLLTPSFKLKRHEARKYFQDSIERLYTE